jgi:hypothetical protein
MGHPGPETEEHTKMSNSTKSVTRRAGLAAVLLAAAGAGATLGLAANAHADSTDDFWDCLASHSDLTEKTVCCIFYNQPCGVPADDTPPANLQQPPPPPRTPPTMSNPALLHTSRRA